MSIAETENPYAVPLSSGPLVVEEAVNQQIYRSGNFLVMHKKAQLPNRCVKSNQPTTQGLQRELSWHPPAIYLLLPLLPVYAILMPFVRRSATVRIPLSAGHKFRRMKWMLVSWLIPAVGVSFMWFAGSSGLGSDYDLPVVFLALSPILALIAGVIGIYGCRVVYAAKIEGDFVKIGGVCEQFLEGLQEFPLSI
jgi:hypothetical protein